VPIEDQEARLLEAGTGCEELCEDVLAAALLLEHVAQTADLALDAGQAVKQFFVFFGIHFGSPKPVDRHTPWGYRDPTIQRKPGMSTRLARVSKGRKATMAEVREITDANFENDVIKSELPTLVDFWAPWCGPCRMVKPIVEELSEEYAGKVNFMKMDTDENPQIPTKYGIRSIPSLLIFQGGELKGTIVGFRPKSDLKTRIDEALA
jgi:thioredoxin 1